MLNLMAKAKSTQNLLFTNISEALTLTGVAQKYGRKVQATDLAPIKDAAIAVVNGRIAWIGSQKSLRKSDQSQIFGRKKPKEIDLQKRSLVPGFVECHTHLLFAGDRRQDFELRNQGITYQEIAARGGGIRSTMRATREASSKTLQKLGQRRVQRFIDQGVTTLEVKSGYGLDLKSEIKILKAAKVLTGPEIITTFLGPHSLPPEFKDYDQYLIYLENEVLPLVAKKKLAERVDIFIEQGFFSNNQAEKWFSAAKALGLKIVAHTDQLTAGGGSRLSLRYQALSVDHAVHLHADEIKLLAASETTAVLLPTSDFYLKVAYPEARKMIDAGARVALATDFNPGTSPSQDLSLVGVLARLEMKMTLPEVIAAYTYNAAAALDRQNQIGSLEVGKNADFAVIDGSWSELFYEVGYHPVHSIWRQGRSL